MNPFYLVLNPDNTISFNRPLAHAIGLSETILYGALVAKWYYYSERDMLDEDGWFYSTVPDLQESTSLTEKQQKRCIKALVDLKLIKCETKGMPARRCFHLIDDYQKIIELIEIGKSISEEIKPAAFEKNQLKIMAREERKNAVGNVENPEQSGDDTSPFSDSDDEKSRSAPFAEQKIQKTGDENSDENSSQTAWLPSSAKRSEQVPPKGPNKFRHKVGISSAQREYKSKYNQSKGKNLYIIDKSPNGEKSGAHSVENFSDSLIEQVRKNIGYYSLMPVAGLNFADCAVKAVCELMTADKPVKIGPCEISPDVISKTISHVNMNILMQVSDKIYKKRGKIRCLPAYLKTAIFQQTCEYLMLPQNEFEFEGYAEMRDFCKTYLSL